METPSFLRPSDLPGKPLDVAQCGCGAAGRVAGAGGLHWAATTGHSEVCKVLLEMKVGGVVSTKMGPPRGMPGSVLWSWYLSSIG